LEFRKDLKNKKAFFIFPIGRGLKPPHRPSLALDLTTAHSPHSGPKKHHHVQPSNASSGPARLRRHHGAEAESEPELRMEFIPFGLNLTNAETSLIEGSKRLHNRILFEIRPKPR
jgi:hypothetical protein